MGIALCIVIGTLVWANLTVPASKPLPTITTFARTTKVLQVVAAENFWGSLVSQLGGTHVHVVSIVSDPNADPHEYETNTGNAREVADADYVIVNGAGYDSWAGKLLGAGTKPERGVLNVADLLGKKEGDNPHFWYNPEYVNQTIAQMERDLVKLDPADEKYFTQQYQTVQTSFAKQQARITEVKRQFSGVNVASTEDVFVYLADATELKLMSPPAFIQAVGEGTDPPTASVVAFEGLLKSRAVEVLIYNQQTVTPLTETMKKLATDEGIPIVGVTETIQPPNETYQVWMDAQVKELQDALRSISRRN